MKRQIFPLCLLFSIFLNAQVFEIKTLASIKDEKSPVDIIKVRGGYCGLERSAAARFGWTVNLEKMKSACKLILFDDNMDFVRENKLAEGRETFGPFPPFLEEINNRPYFIYYNYNNNAIDIFAAQIDIDTPEIKDASKVLTIDQKNIGLFKMMNLYGSYRLFIETSPDKTKILVLWCPGVNNSLMYSVVDNNMNIIKTKNETIDGATNLTINNLFIDNEGNFFAGYTYKKKETYYSNLFAANIKGDARNITLMLDDASAHDVFVSNGSSESQIRVYGTYSKDGYYITGGFTEYMDKKTFKFSDLVVKAVPEDMMEKFENDGFAKTKKKTYGLFPEIRVANIILENGTAVIVGDLKRYQGGGYGVQTIKGTALNMLFGNNAIIINRIPKKETGVLVEGNNFYLHKYGEKAILFYADLPSNINIPIRDAKTTEFTDKKDNVMVAAVIEKDGTIIRHILYPDASGSTHFSPDLIQTVGDNSLLFHLDKDKLRLTAIKTTYTFYLLNISE